MGRTFSFDWGRGRVRLRLEVWANVPSYSPMDAVLGKRPRT